MMNLQIHAPSHFLIFPFDIHLFVQECICKAHTNNPARALSVERPQVYICDLLSSALFTFFHIKKKLIKSLEPFENPAHSFQWETNTWSRIQDIYREGRVPATWIREAGRHLQWTDHSGMAPMEVAFDMGLEDAKVSICE